MRSVRLPSRLRPCLLLAVLAVGGLAASPGRAAEFRSGETVVVNGPLGEDLFVAGQTIAVNGPLDGDVYAAGYEVGIAGPVAEDVTAAGYRVDLRSDIGRDLMAAGIEVSIGGRVGGDALVIGASDLRLPRGSAIGGDLNATGAEIEILGDIAGEARLAGGRITIGGRIAGDLDVAADELILLPGASIMGDIRHEGPDRPEITAGVTVGGEIVQQDWGDEAEDYGPTFLGTVGSAVALFVLGAVLFLVAPRFVVASAADIRARPVRDFLLGLLVIVGAPILMAIFFVTIIGIPIGLILLMLYVAAFPVGLALAGFGLAEMADRKGGAQTAADRLKRFAFFALLLMLLNLVPVLGGLAVFILTTMGMGAILALAFGSRRPPQPTW